MDKSKIGKIIFYIIMIILLSILIISFVTTASAHNLFKWQLCDASNMSGGDCDDYWESFKDAMGIKDKINVSIDEAKTRELIEEYFNKIYNKTDIDRIIKTINLTNSSGINIDTLNNSLKNEMIALRNNLMDELENSYVTQREFDRYGTNNSDIGVFIGIGILILVVIGGGFYFMNKKSKPETSPYENGKAKNEFKKIQRISKEGEKGKEEK